MRIKNISFPTYLEDSQGIENSIIDVFVKVEDDLDDYTYIVTLATPKFIEYEMDNNFYNGKMNYQEPGLPYILVKELTQEIIEETLQAYAEYRDGYWLKLYHFDVSIEETLLNQLQAEAKKLEESD